LFSAFSLTIKLLPFNPSCIVFNIIFFLSFGYVSEWSSSGYNAIIADIKFDMIPSYLILPFSVWDVIFELKAIVPAPLSSSYTVLYNGDYIRSSI
jgi:hypothetical protein